MGEALHKKRIPKIRPVEWRSRPKRVKETFACFAMLRIQSQSLEEMFFSPADFTFLECQRTGRSVGPGIFRVFSEKRLNLFIALGETSLQSKRVSQIVSSCF